VVVLLVMVVLAVVLLLRLGFAEQFGEGGREVGREHVDVRQQVGTGEK
jgi:hypothetical protein